MSSYIESTPELSAKTAETEPQAQSSFPNNCKWNLLSEFSIDAANDSLPSFCLEREIAKVETATKIKTYVDLNGFRHRDYYLADHKIFTEIQTQGGQILNSYDMLGRVEGTMTVRKDGQSVSTFKGFFDTYRVVRDRNVIRVSKLGLDDFEPLLEPEEASEVLRQEKCMFRAPHLKVGA